MSIDERFLCFLEKNITHPIESRWGVSNFSLARVCAGFALIFYVLGTWKFLPISDAAFGHSVFGGTMNVLLVFINVLVLICGGVMGRLITEGLKKEEARWKKLFRDDVFLRMIRTLFLFIFFPAYIIFALTSGFTADFLLLVATTGVFFCVSLYPILLPKNEKTISRGS